MTAVKTSAAAAAVVVVVVVVVVVHVVVVVVVLVALIVVVHVVQIDDDNNDDVDDNEEKKEDNLVEKKFCWELQGFFFSLGNIGNQCSGAIGRGNETDQRGVRGYFKVDEVWENGRWCPPGLAWLVKWTYLS
ncbi:hypothetical protein ElyMa_000158000 [Elysia marginata]|uniref:Transmembrane protein n=1 Tax=Elysia marginata TaxID=1093978 RepID=A0AAV4ERS0_9GAST|nr:hypothetical protein ElyMa_000158000 [Elysia marginata]